MSKVIYIKYNKGLRTTTVADTNKQGFIVKQERIAAVAPIVSAVVDDQEYMDMLTNRMFEKIRLNKLRLNGGR